MVAPILATATAAGVKSMNPLSLLDGPMSGGGLALHGGDAGPATAYSSSGGNYLTMNSPFTVAGSGSKATSGNSDGTGTQTLIVLALIAAAVLMVVTK